MRTVWSWLVGRFRQPRIIICRSPGDYEGPLAYPKEFAEQMAAIYQQQPDASE